MLESAAYRCAGSRRAGRRARRCPARTSSTASRRATGRRCRGARRSVGVGRRSPQRPCVHERYQASDDAPNARQNAIYTQLWIPRPGGAWARTCCRCRCPERGRQRLPSARVREARSRGILLRGEAHEGQQRLTGDPYIVHPSMPALTVAGLQLDAAAVAAALLHDVPGGLRRPQRRTQAPLRGRNRQAGRRRDQAAEDAWLAPGERAAATRHIQAENLRKMFLAMAEDIRVVLIKLADRLHNMRTLDAMPPREAAPRSPRRRWRSTRRWRTGWASGRSSGSSRTSPSATSSRSDYKQIARLVAVEARRARAVHRAGR